MLRTIPAIDIKGLSLWLKDPDSEGLTLRVGEDSSQVYQFKIRKLKSNDWQQLVFSMTDFFARRETDESIHNVTNTGMG
jgi:hypothetical protein